MPGPSPLLKAFADDERGATAIEYAMIAALLSMLAIVGVITLGDSLVALWTYIVDGLAAAFA